MIVDTMTFDEITEYLLKTSFSTNRLVEVEQKYIVPKANIQKGDYQMETEPNSIRVQDFQSYRIKGKL